MLWRIFGVCLFLMIFSGLWYLTLPTSVGVVIHRICAKYGRLTADYRNDIAQGLSECWRVLQPFGILVFKWNEEQIKVAPILKRFGREPLFGHITGRSGKTRWYCFMKTDE